MNPISRFLRWLNRSLEIGFARKTYADLYSAGVITQDEYLRLLKESEEKIGE